MNPETPINQIPTPTPNPAQTPETPSPLKQIRTFEGDVADAIKRQNESLISIQRAEERRRTAVGNLAPTLNEEHHLSWKPLVMSLFTIVFIVGGGFGAYYTWTTYNTKVALPQIETPKNQFVSALTLRDVDASTLGRQAVISVVHEVRGGDRDISAIEQVEMRRVSGTSSELLSTEDFLTRLASHAPKPLIRSFNDLFMLGVLGANPAHTFMLVKLDSFENAYPGMLEWEPRLAEDLLPLFAEDNVVLSTPSSREFEDKTIQNHDTRVLRGGTGEIVLIYGFFDNNLLVVTDTDESFRTIINRLQSEKLSR